jgi:ankyrin repeat protein
MLKIRFGQLRFVLTCLLQNGWTPLHHACSRGHVEVVTVLLAAGAQVDAEDQVWTVEIRVDLSSSGYMHSPPSCLL